MLSEEKKLYRGLSNQGATCYMNSLLPNSAAVWKPSKLSIHACRHKRLNQELWVEHKRKL